MVTHDIYETRYTNVRALLDNFRTLKEFAAAVGKPPGQCSSFAGRNPSKRIGDTLAREIERACGLQEYELDFDPLAYELNKADTKTREIVSRILGNPPVGTADV